MSKVRRFLSRRSLLGFVGIAALLLGLAMLHPYPRQSLFGPTIEEVPWCVWENHARRRADSESRPGLIARILEGCGIHLDEDAGLDLESRAALPIWIHLAEDANVRVRQRSLLAICGWSEKEPVAILPIFQRHLADADPFCRLVSSQQVWFVAKDPMAIIAALSLKDHTDAHVRQEMFQLLLEMASGEPSLFEPFAAATEDTDPGVRMRALRSMSHYGQRGIPIVRKALRGKDLTNQQAAIVVVFELGPAGTELRPELLALKNHPVPAFRELVSLILERIDSKKFPVRGE